MKRILAFVLSLCIVLGLCACGSESGKSSDKATLTIAYQGGTGYAPVHIMQAKAYIETEYKNSTGKEVEVKFQKLDSGADINTGIIGGSIDIGCMGLGPAISAVASKIPAKIMTGLCSQSHGLMTSDKNIKSLADIGNEQIALVNIGSFQHILLAMACEKELSDPHALDNNIVKMAHAEGYAALEAGTYKLHLTSSPYINRERENPNFTEIKAVNEVWPDGNIFLVALASTKLQEENKELFDAVTKAFSQAIEFINNNAEESAEIVAKQLGADVDTTLADMTDETSSFFTELKGVTQMAEFMYRAEFINTEVSLDDLVFSGVSGN